MSTGATDAKSLLSGGVHYPVSAHPRAPWTLCARHDTALGMATVFRFGSRIRLVPTLVGTNQKVIRGGVRECGRVGLILTSLERWNVGIVFGLTALKPRPRGTREMRERQSVRWALAKLDFRSTARQLSRRDLRSSHLFLFLSFLFSSSHFSLTSKYATGSLPTF